MFEPKKWPHVWPGESPARKGGLIGATLRSWYLASRYAVLEAEWLLLRAITIVSETSATSPSQ